MATCLFVTDLHGSESRYTHLFRFIQSTEPDGVFIGGDLLPSGIATLSGATNTDSHFLMDFLKPQLMALKKDMGSQYPEIFSIMGNDDGKMDEPRMEILSELGLWQYCQERMCTFSHYQIWGYAYIPPSPFQLKDWERYDMGSYVDPGCIPPEDGFHSVETRNYDKRYRTIHKDLYQTKDKLDFHRAILLFHAPPHNTPLDHADLQNTYVDHAPLDKHVGSVAIRRFIERFQPKLTLHGHIHEATRLSGQWSMKLGKTVAFNAAHDGKELSIIQFNLENLDQAERLLLGG